MTGLRLLARSRRRLTLALALCALAVRLIVPAGFMPEAGRFALVICTGHKAMAAMAMPHDKPAPPDSGGKTDQPCGFGGAVAVALSAIDPIFLAAAIAFIVALGRITGDAPPVRARTWLRPPLRGPPAFGLA